MEEAKLVQDAIQTMVKDLMFWMMIAACVSGAWVGVLAVWRGYWQTKRLQADNEYANAWAKKKGRKRY